MNPNSTTDYPADSKRQRTDSPHGGPYHPTWVTCSGSGVHTPLNLDDVNRLEAAFGVEDHVILRDSCKADLANMTLTKPGQSHTQRLERLLKRKIPSDQERTSNRRIFDGRIVYLNRLAGAPDSPDTLTFADVIGNVSEIDSMLLSAFGSDLDWLASMVGTSVPITLVDDKNVVGEGPANITIEYPPFPRSDHFFFKLGTMHAKLMLIKYTTNILRIAITSANLIPFDWGFITQTIWVIDIDRTRARSAVPPSTQSNFGADLAEFVGRLIPPQNAWIRELGFWIDSINQTVPPEISLVASVPGTFYGQNALKYGQLRLRELVRNFSPGLVQYQMSSIGKLETQFKTDFIQSIGASPFKIVFPTFNDAVSLDGKENIFLNQKNSISVKPFLTPLTWTSERRHALNHSKCIHADAWMYYGSHNLSMPAWGRFDSDRTTFRVASFELGIFIEKTRNMTLNVPWNIQSDPQPMTCDPWMHDVYIQRLQEGSLGEDGSPPPSDDRNSASQESACVSYIRDNAIELLCLDVDGTVVEDNTSSALIPSVVSFLSQIDTSRTKIALVTNQGAVGLRHWMEVAKFGEPEKFPTRQEVETRLEKIRSEIQSITKAPTVKLFAAYRYQSKGTNGRWCPVPFGEKEDPKWSQDWRKPNPGMIREAVKWAKISPLTGLKKVLMVGDMDADEGAAKAAGVRFAKAPDFFKQ